MYAAFWDLFFLARDLFLKLNIFLRFSQIAGYIYNSLIPSTGQIPFWEQATTCQSTLLLEDGWSFPGFAITGVL